MINLFAQISGRGCLECFENLACFHGEMEISYHLSVFT